MYNIDDEDERQPPIRSTLISRRARWYPSTRETVADQLHEAVDALRGFDRMRGRRHAHRARWLMTAHKHLLAALELVERDGEQNVASSFVRVRRAWFKRVYALYNHRLFKIEGLGSISALFASTPLTWALRVRSRREHRVLTYLGVCMHKRTRTISRTAKLRDDFEITSRLVLLAEITAIDPCPTFFRLKRAHEVARKSYESTQMLAHMFSEEERS